jgi:hypothetical protein
VVARQRALGRDRGGEGIPSLYASRVRLIVSVLATAIATGLALYPLFQGGWVGIVADALAGIGVLAVLGAVAGLARLLPLGLVALGAELAVAELFGSAAPALALLYAPGLLALAELVYWSRSLRGPARLQPAVVADRAGLVVLCAAGASVAAAVALVGGGIHLRSPLAAAVAGVAASVALLVVAWLLAARQGAARSG